jgi:hypothetical protein
VAPELTWPGRRHTPGRLAVEQQEDVVVQPAEVDREPVQELLADDVAGIPQMGHSGVDHPGSVDLLPGVQRPALDPDHIDP